MNSLLEIKNLCVTYKDKIAVKNFNLKLGKREIISIVGESGSGKSTVIKTILKLLSESAEIKEGSILFNDKDLISIDNKKLQDIRGKDIGMIFQDAGASMNPIKTIEKQFIEFLKTHNDISKKEAREIAKSWLKKLKLKDSERVLNSYPFELSGGMKQRVILAMVLSQSPEILLADEPTSALDVTIQAQVVKELKQMRDLYGTSIIMVTHDMGIASYISDKIGVMKNGELVEFGTKDEIINKPQNDYTKLLLESVLNLE